MEGGVREVKGLYRRVQRFAIIFVCIAAHPIKFYYIKLDESVQRSI